MTAGSRSSPAITIAGSPGRSCCSEKIRIDTNSNVGTSWAMRRARKFSIAALLFPRHCSARALQCLQETILCRSPSLQLQPGHAHQAVGHLLVALELVALRDQDTAVIEIENRFFVELEFGQLLVGLLALGHIGGEASLFHGLVGIGVRPDAIVLRTAGV